MRNELLIRTEEITPDEVLRLLVASPPDRTVIEALKGRSPIVLKGSRGVGKSFLLRATEAELVRDFDTMHILPVYLRFVKAVLIGTPTAETFLAWMIAKICNRIIRTASTLGVALPRGSALAAIQGGGASSPLASMEVAERRFEESWRGATTANSTRDIPGSDILVDAAEELCRGSGLSRIVLLVDEAAHVFIPEQQRQFFTLMRDLRSPYLSVKAAVYPGTTAFGDSFEPSHDATFISLDRNVTDSGYLEAMREIVVKQNDTLRKPIEQYGEEFDTLAFAASGNPRQLLKTISRTPAFNRKSAEETIREYYRGEVWSYHSKLAEKYPGHRRLIDWGRNLIEQAVLPELHARNRRLAEQSSYIWVHRDIPKAAWQALQLLCYSGILQEGDSGIRLHEQVGTRYMVNLGCLFAEDGDPLGFAVQVRKSLSVRKMVELTPAHDAFKAAEIMSLVEPSNNGNEALQARLRTSIDVLEVSPYQRKKLVELGLTTVGGVLEAETEAFMKARYVGAVRARQIKNAAVAAVLEYLSG
jgi:hypothetical protein